MPPKKGEYKMPLEHREKRTIEKTDPDRFLDILSALKEGTMPVHQIAHEFKTSLNTIYRIRHQYADQLPDHRQMFVSRTKRIIEKTLDRYEQDLDAGKIDRDKLPVHAGILVDKLALSEGRPTSISERRNIDVSQEMVSDLINSLPDEKVIDVETTENQQDVEKS